MSEERKPLTKEPLEKNKQPQLFTRDRQVIVDWGTTPLGASFVDIYENRKTVRHYQHR